MNILADTREPYPHPWERFLPEGWVFERGTLETGIWRWQCCPKEESSSARHPATWRTVLEKAAKGSRGSCAAVEYLRAHGGRHRGHPI